MQGQSSLFAGLPAPRPPPPPEAPAAEEPPAAAEAPAIKRARTAAEEGVDDVTSALRRLATHAVGPKFGKALQLATGLLSARPTTLRRAHGRDALALLRALLGDGARSCAPEWRCEAAALCEAALALRAHEGLFPGAQGEELDVLALLCVTCNGLFTDDSFSFGRVAAEVRSALEALPTLAPPPGPDTAAEQEPPEALQGLSEAEAEEARAMCARMAAAEAVAAAAAAALAERRRDALLRCCEAAAASYRWPWAQSVVDLLMEAAQGALHKFPPPQAERLAATVEAVRAARVRRRAGGGGGGGGETSFERGTAKFAGAAISIRHAVGGGLGKDGRGESCAKNFVP